MPILTSGSTTTVTLGAYDSITLQNRSGQAASISVGGAVVNGNHSGSRTYGPYPSGGSVSLNAISGDLYYEVADGAGDAKRVFARGSSLLAEDGSTVSAGGVFVPVLPTPEAIDAAALKCAESGGGIVDLTGIRVTKPSGLIPYDGVIYRGGGAISYTFYNDTIIFEDSNSTIITGDGTQPGYGWNWQDRAVPLNQDGSSVPLADRLSDLVLRGGGVQHLALVNFLHGVKVGAKYNPGVNHGQFCNLVIHDCPGLGFWYENCQQGYVRDITVFNCGQGAGGFVASIGGNIWNYGNYVVENVFAQLEAPRATLKTHGWVVGHYGSTAGDNFNDVHIHGIQSNCIRSDAGRLAISASFAADGLISLADVTNLCIDAPVFFSSAVGTVSDNICYFVVELTQNPGLNSGTIRIAAKPSGAPISTGATGTAMLNFWGMPGLLQKGVMTYSSITGIDIETQATATAVFSDSIGCRFDLNLQSDNPGSFVGVAIRAASPTTRFESVAALRWVDIDLASQSVISWHGLRYQQNRQSTQTHRGWGLQFADTNLANTSYPFGTSNTAILELGGNKRLLSTNDSGAIFPSLLGAMTMTVGNISGGSMGGDWAQVQTYNLTAPGSVNLIAGNGGFVGVLYCIENASDFPLTVNATGGRTFDGVSGWTAVTLAPRSSLLVRYLRTDNATASTSYWKIEAAGQIIGAAITTSKTLTFADVPPIGLPVVDVTTTGLTLTLDGKVGSFDLMIPAGGQVTLAVSGSATINGGVSSVSRTFASNAGGIVCVRRGSSTAAYRVSGA